MPTNAFTRCCHSICVLLLCMNTEYTYLLERRNLNFYLWWILFLPTVLWFIQTDIRHCWLEKEVMVRWMKWLPGTWNHGTEHKVWQFLLVICHSWYSMSTTRGHRILGPRNRIFALVAIPNKEMSPLESWIHWRWPPFDSTFHMRGNSEVARKL